MSIDLDGMRAKLALDSSDFQTGIDGANKSISGFSEKLKSVGTKVVDFGRSMTTAITLPILAAGFASVKMASDLSESISLADQVFESSAATIQSWSKTTARAFGISRNDALTMSSTLGLLLTNMGFTDKAAADMSMQMVQLAADMASAKNVPVAEALDAIRSALVGESEPMRNFGVRLDEASIKAEALRLGLYNGTGELTANARAQAALSLIMAGTTKMQGNFALTAEGAANQTKIFRAQLADAGATIGMQLLPGLISLLNTLNDLIVKFQNLSPQQQKMIEAAVVFAAIIGPLALAIGFIATNLTAFGAALGVIIAPLTTVLGLLLMPVNWPIIAGSALLKTNVLGLGDAMRAVAGTISDAVRRIVDTTTDLYNKVRSKFDDLKTAVPEAVVALKDGALTAVGDLAAGAKAWLDTIEIYFTNAFESVKTTVGTKLGELYVNAIAILTTLATDLFNGAFNAGYGLGQGIIDGVNAIWDSVTSFVGDLVGAVLDKLSNIPGFSPIEHVGEYYGAKLGQGFASGIASASRSVSAAASGMTGSAMSGMNMSGASLAGYGGGAWTGANGGATHNYGGITIQVSGAGDPDAVADRVFAKFTRELGLR